MGEWVGEGGRCAPRFPGGTGRPAQGTVWERARLSFSPSAKAPGCESLGEELRASREFVASPENSVGKGLGLRPGGAISNSFDPRSPQTRNPPRRGPSALCCPPLSKGRRGNRGRRGSRVCSLP